MPTITQRDPVSETSTLKGPVQITKRQTDKIEAPAGNLETAKEDANGALKEEMLSPKYAALARREANLRLKAKQLEADREALKAKEAQYQSDYIPKAQLEERFKTDPLSLMNEHGLSYEKLTEIILNAPTQADPALVAIQAKLKAIEETQEKTTREFTERQNKAYEQAVTQIRNEAKLLVDSNDEFSTIKETDSTEAIVDLIKLTHEEEGIILEVEDAAKQVEAHLLEEALKMARLKKVQAKLTPQEEAEVAAAESKQTAPTLKTPPMKTLTNTQMPSVTKSLSARERAILAFQGKQNAN